MSKGWRFYSLMAALAIVSVVLNFAVTSFAATVGSAPNTTPDLSAYATKAELTAAQSALTAADNANMASVAAMVPLPAQTTPNSEGSAAVGSLTTRYALADHVHARITRAAAVMTDGTGAWSVTWSSALASTPVVLPVPVNSGSQPVTCNVTTRTTTGASGKCWLAQVLPSSILSLSVLVSFNPQGGTASGVTVQVLAIPPTQ